MGLTALLEAWLGRLPWERNVPTHCLVELQEAWDACLSSSADAVKHGPFLWKTAELVLAWWIGLVVGVSLVLFCTCGVQVTCIKRASEQASVSDGRHGASAAGAERSAPYLGSREGRRTLAERDGEPSILAIRGRSRSRRGVVA